MAETQRALRLEEALVATRRDKLNMLNSHAPAIGQPISALEPAAATAVETDVQFRRFQTYVRTVEHLRYAQLYKKLKLSTEKQNAFDAVAADYDQRLHDLNETAAQQGLDPRSGDLAILRGNLAKDMEAAEAAILTNDQIQEANQYQRMAYARTVVAGVAGEVYGSEPLTNEQSEAISTAMAKASPSFQSGGNLDADLDVTQAESTLASILTPSQSKALHYILQGNKGSADVTRLVAAAQAK